MTTTWISNEARANYQKNEMPSFVAQETFVENLVNILNICEIRIKSEQRFIDNFSNNGGANTALEIIVNAALVANIELCFHIQHRISQIISGGLPPKNAVAENHIVPAPEPLPAITSTSAQHMCSACGVLGHNKRSLTCPKNRKLQPKKAIVKTRRHKTTTDNSMLEEAAKLLADPRVFKHVECCDETFSTKRVDYRKLGGGGQRSAAERKAADVLLSFAARTS